MTTTPNVNTAVEQATAAMLAAIDEKNVKDFSFHFSLGEQVLTLQNGYGSYAVDLFVVHLRQQGADVGRSTCYAATRYVTQLTKDQKDAIIRMRMPIRMLNLLCRECVTHDLRNSILEIYRKTRPTISQVRVLIEQAIGRPAKPPVNAIAASIEHRRTQAFNNAVAACNLLLDLYPAKETSRKTVISRIMGQVSQELEK